MRKLSICTAFLFCVFLLTAQTDNMNKSIPEKPTMQQGSMADKDEVNIFFWEDFDTGIFPPSGWNLISGSTPETWKPGTSLIYPPFSGDYFAICRYDDTYIPEGQDERLYTSTFSLAGLSDATLSFWFIFSRYWGITPYNNYDLQVLLSLDGGATFNDTIWTELSTDTASWSSWEWVRADVDLTSYTGQTNVQLCFRYVGYDGADAAIENVEISFLTGINEMTEGKYKLYPNPANNYLILEGQGSKEITVFDLTGKEVLFHCLHEGEVRLHLSSVPPGYYFIRVSSEDKAVYSVFPLIIQ
jgi:hypothetical protein